MEDGFLDALALLVAIVVEQAEGIAAQQDNGYKVAKNAQKTAEQFAEASKSDLGQILTAGQGQFEIENRDQNTPYIKKLRVVTTITYSLDN